MTDPKAPESGNSNSHPKPEINKILADANVLINFIHIDRLDVFGRIKECHFMTPVAVLAEISRPDQEIKINRIFQRIALRSQKYILHFYEKICKSNTKFHERLLSEPA